MSQPSPAGSTEFRLRLLGAPALVNAAQEPVTGLGPGKPLALLAYLAVAGPASRDTLVALLWGDVPEARARNAFRQTLHRLRASLGETAVPQENGVLALARSRVSVDVDEFDSAARVGDLARAVALFRGEFLEGLRIDSASFTQWMDEQRQRLAARYRAAVTRLAEEALESGDAQRAAELAHNLTTMAPLEGEAAVLEAAALVAAGRRAEAIAALTVHSSRVQADLGRAPDGAVAKMLARLLRTADGDRISGGAHERRAEQGDRIPFVGRERELAALLAFWRRVQRGQGETILVAGPEGIGKSRLVEEMVDRARALGPLTLFRGRENARADAAPYASIAEALRDVASAPGLAGASQHLLAEAARLLPQLRDRFQLPEAGPITDESERIRFYEGIAALLDALAYERPLLLIIEDVDAASQATITLLRYLSNRLRGVSVFLVLTARAGAAIQLGDDTIELEPLREPEALELLNGVLGSEHPTADERRRLVALGAGIPYRLVDLAERSLAAEVPTAAPVRLRDVMLRRLQRCTPHQQRVFVACALLGRAVPIRLLAAAAHLSEAAALDAVLELERKGLVEQRQHGVEPANATVAELALETTGAAGVALLAGWAADALALDSGSRAAELVHLYTLAGRHAEVHSYGLKAAWDAACAGATADALRYATGARETARSDSQRAAAESLVVTLGGGKRQLPGATAQSHAPAEAAADEPANVGTSLPTNRVARWASRGWGIRPQIAVAGAAVLVMAVALRIALADRAPAPGTVLSDTLMVAARATTGETELYDVSGSLDKLELGRRRPAQPAIAWTETLARPWTNPLPAPGGNHVAVEHVTARGTDLFVISADRRDTVPIATGQGDAIALDWSPDGSRILLLRSRSDAAGEYHTELVAQQVNDPRVLVAFDTGSASAVFDATWSPRGDRVAWAARTGAERQQEIFVSAADGSERSNISNHPAEDFQLAWSPDGERLAFLSERSGGVDVYAYELAARQLRRMTFDRAPKNQLAFSTDGRFLAYESTRGGLGSVYLMPSWAGVPLRVGGSGRRLSLVGWRGRTARPASSVRIRAPATITPGRPVRITAEVSDETARELESARVRWSALEPSVLAIAPRSAADSAMPRNSIEITGLRAGVGRVVADLGGWRADTFFVQVAASAVVVRSTFPDGSLRGWRVAGAAPLPPSNTGGARGLALGGAGRSEIGLISEAAIPLIVGTALRMRVSAPFASRSAIPAGWSVALVAAEATAPDGRVRPSRTLAGIEWRGESARLAYVAERETATEQANVLTNGAHEFSVRVESDGRITFHVDGRRRHRSTVRVLQPGEELLAQVRIGGRGERGSIVVEAIEARQARPPRGR